MSFIGNMFGGGGADKINTVTPSFVAGGLNADSGPAGGATVTPDAIRSSDVAGISSAFGNQANTLSGLRAGIMPGYNDLLRSRLNDINDTASRAIGNLSQNLAARRVLGSSFGADTIARANNEFQRTRDAAIADNYIKSLSASTDILNQETQARRQQFQSGLDELNLEAGIANVLATNASSQINQNAQAQAKLDAQAQQGAGQFFGGLFGKVASPTLTSLGNAINPFSWA